MVGLGPVFESPYFPQGATKIDPPAFVNYARKDYDLDTLLGGKERFGEQFLRENRVDILDRWLEPNPVLKYVEDRVSVGIMMPAKGTYHSANIAGVTIPYSIIDLNLKDVGKYVSMQHNFRQHLMDYMRSDEGYRLAEWLNELGYKAEDIDYIAIGFVPEKAICAIGRLPNGKIAIYANNDYHKKIEKWAESDDMPIGEVIEAVIGEELVHNFRRSYDKRFGRIREEKATKKIEKEFYENLAKKTLDSGLKEKYSRIIKHLEGDIATISRYVKLYSRNSSELEAILKAEAKENGVSKEEIKDYVSERLEEIAEAAKNEYSECETEEDIDAEMSGEFDAYGGVESILEGEVCAELVDSVEGDGEACAEADGGDSGGDAGGGE